jgi:hypothetical protein
MHQQTLELRVAVAEVWGRLARETDETRVAEEVELARGELDDSLAERRQRLIARQQELETQQAQVIERNREFRIERELAARQLAAQAEALEIQERNLREQRRRLAEREQQWREVLDRSEIERRRAERVIRNLLEQLDQAVIQESAGGQGANAA